MLTLEKNYKSLSHSSLCLKIRKEFKFENYDSEKIRKVNISPFEIENSVALLLGAIVLIGMKYEL